MLTATKSAPTAASLRVLLVGTKEEDFFLVREILERNRKNPPAYLDHALNLEEAQDLLQRKDYSVVLLQHDAGRSQTIEALDRVQRKGARVPYILLTEDTDEETVADILGCGAWNSIPRTHLDRASLVRTIHGVLALHSLKHEQQVAEESVRKLSRAVEQSPDAVMITDRNGVIEYVNPAFEAMTTYSREEACGSTPAILKSGEQGPEAYEELWRTILAGNVYRGILVNRKKSGEKYYVEENISPVRDAAGEITHFISNSRDLTERHRLEAELRQAQKMDAVGNLAGGVAHDFNNLLTIITSYAELALDNVVPNSPLQAKIQEILAAARRAAELTRQLLAFSRKQPQALRVVEINSVIAGIAKTLPRLIGEDIELSFKAGENLGRARVDPVQIEQILMNLAANARDAMPQGGRFQIETSDLWLDDEYIHRKQALIPVGRYVLITVSDTGAGIPAHQLPHIFEPFYTTKPLREGTGLGLATVYGIVKQNKGFVWAYSEPGMGTVFKIYLPCVAAQHAKDLAEKVGPESTPRGSETILLVEDEAAVRRAAAEFLTQQGYSVLEAKDGKDALHLASQHSAPIHLAVTDVVMPNMSGGELAKELALSRPETKLLFISGYAGKTVVNHNVAGQEPNFLQKPFTLKQLASKVRETLNHAGRGAAAAGS